MWWPIVANTKRKEDNTQKQEKVEIRRKQVQHQAAKENTSAVLLVF